jgi:hypothetical protein
MIITNSFIHKLVTNTFYHTTMNTIIAPHGVTDVIHAIQTRNIPNLLKYYGGAIVCGEVCYMNHIEPIWYSIFVATSIIHFRHDFDKILYITVPKPVSYGLTIAFLGIVNQQSLLWPFYLYMLLIHVPNHYSKAWSYVKDYPALLASFISIASVVSDMLLVETISNEVWIAVLSIVIGHIIYEERFIWSNPDNNSIQ